MPEFRGKTTDATLATLRALQKLWGYRYLISVVEHLASEAHHRYLQGGAWGQTQHRAYQVLRRLRPSYVGLQVSDITGVAFVNHGQVVEISVVLEAQPFKVKREDWEK